jgi:hypothetical protein
MIHELVTDRHAICDGGDCCSATKRVLRVVILCGDELDDFLRARPRGELQPTKEDLAIASALGQRVATIAKKLRTEVYNTKN